MVNSTTARASKRAPAASPETQTDNPALGGAVVPQCLGAHVSLGPDDARRRRASSSATRIKESNDTPSAQLTKAPGVNPGTERRMAVSTVLFIARAVRAAEA